jgi:DNA-binding XRE family transcriptional regulator
MTTSAWWVDTRGRFDDLITRGAHALEAWDSDLLGGSSMVRCQFVSFATAAGRAATGSTADEGYGAWLTLLRERLQPLRPNYFSVATSLSVRPRPRTIPLSRISPPRKLPSRAEDPENRQKDEKDIDPTTLVEAAELAGFFMVVLPRKGDRFEVVSSDYSTYCAYVALNRTKAKCVVHEAEASTVSKPKRRRQPTLREEKKYRVIRNVCQASVELCEVLEAEAFAEEAGHAVKPQRLHHRQEAGPTDSLGRNIDRLRTECGLSQEELADKIGVRREAVIQHINRGVTPQPKTLRHYAKVFSAFLHREVTLSEIRGCPDRHAETAPEPR